MAVVHVNCKFKNSTFFFFSEVIFPFFLLRIHYAVESLNWNRQFLGGGKKCSNFISLFSGIRTPWLWKEREKCNFTTKDKKENQRNRSENSRPLLPVFLRNFSTTCIIFTVSKKKKRSSWEGVVNISSFSRQPFFLYISLKEKRKKLEKKEGRFRGHMTYNDARGWREEKTSSGGFLNTNGTISPVHSTKNPPQSPENPRCAQPPVCVTHYHSILVIQLQTKKRDSRTRTKWKQNKSRMF